MSLFTGNIVWVGDSITAGNHVGAGEDFPTLVTTQLTANGFTVAKHNIGIPSDFLAGTTQGATADGLFDSGKDRNVCVIMLGINDLASGTSGASHEATLQTFCLARRSAGFKIVVCTILPINDAATLARTKTSNSLVRGDASFYDRLVDVGAGSGTTMGADAAPLDGSLYSDTVHPTLLGNQLLEPFMTTEISALLTATGGVSRSRAQVGM